jgi:hypothetical protein
MISYLNQEHTLSTFLQSSCVPWGLKMSLLDTRTQIAKTGTDVPFLSVPQLVGFVAGVSGWKGYILEPDLLSQMAAGLLDRLHSELIDGAVFVAFQGVDA